MILGEQLTIKQFRSITKLKWCVPVGIGHVKTYFEDREDLRWVSNVDNLPRNSFNGLYCILMLLDREFIPLYLGKRSSMSSLRHRIKCHFNYKQNEGKKGRGQISGPLRLYYTIRDMGVSVEYFVSWVPLNGLSSAEVDRAERRVLSKIDFIGNKQNNGDYRMEDLRDFMKRSHDYSLLVDKIRKEEEEEEDDEV